MDPSGLETSDKTIKWSDNSSQNSVESRSYSYRCTFCKRGFSNAQALGGHMNIHRKDRAKLREFSSENLLVLDITKNMDCQDNPDQANSDDKADDDHQENNPGNIDPRVEDSLIRRLPLFSEKPSISSDDHGKEASDDHSEKIIEKGKMELMSHGEVDLELRLGPEPVDSKAINE